MDRRKRKEWISVVGEFVGLRTNFLGIWYRQTSNILEAYNFSNVEAVSDIRQRNHDSIVSSSLSEIYASAAEVKPIFEAAITSLLYSCFTTASVVSSSDGCERYKAQLLEGTVNSVAYITMPLKSKERILEKAKQDYSGYDGPPIARVLDVVRASVVCRSEEDILKLLEGIAQTKCLRVVRCKNRFQSPNYNGYRDFLLSIVAFPDDREAQCSSVVIPGGFVCELQIHHVDVFRSSIQLNSYRFYQYFRTFFLGAAADSKSLTDKLKTLKKMDQIGDDVSRLEPFVKEFLGGKGRVNKDLGRLRNYYLLFHKVEEYNLAEMVQVTIINLLRERNMQAELATALSELSTHLTLFHRYSEALPFYEEALSICEREHGTMHVETARQIGNLADMFYCQQKLDKALPLYKRVQGMYVELLGANHPKTVAAMEHEVDIYEDLRDWANARVIYAKLLAVKSAQCGRESAEVAELLTKLAQLDEIDGAMEDSIAKHSEAVRTREHIYGRSHSTTAESIAALGECYEHLGLLGDALDHHQEALEIRNRLGGLTTAGLGEVTHGGVGAENGGIGGGEGSRGIGAGGAGDWDGNKEDIAYSSNSVGMLLLELGRLEEAKALLQRALEIRLETFADDHILVATSQNNLAEVLIHLGHDLTYAKDLLDKAYKTRFKFYGVRSLATRQTLNNQTVVKELLQMESFRVALATPQSSLGNELQGSLDLDPSVTELQANFASKLEGESMSSQGQGGEGGGQGGGGATGQSMVSQKTGDEKVLMPTGQAMSLRQKRDQDAQDSDQRRLARAGGGSGEYATAATAAGGGSDLIGEQLTSPKRPLGGANMAAAVTASVPNAAGDTETLTLFPPEVTSSLEEDNQDNRSAESSKRLNGELESFSGEQLDSVLAEACSLINAACSNRDNGDYEAAAQQASEAFAIVTKEFGPTSLYSTIAGHHLGMIYEDAGLLLEAEKAFRFTLATVRRVLKRNVNGIYAIALLSLAGVLRTLGKFEEALLIFEEARTVLIAWRETENTTEVASTYHGIAQCYRGLGQADLAMESVKRCIRLRADLLGDEHPDYAAALNTLGLVHVDRGDLMKALAVLRHAVELRETTCGLSHPAFATVANNCAAVFYALRDMSKAGRFFTLSLEVRDRQYGGAAAEVEVALRNLSCVYSAQGLEASSGVLLAAAAVSRNTVPHLNEKFQSKIVKWNDDGL